MATTGRQSAAPYRLAANIPFYSLAFLAGTLWLGSQSALPGATDWLLLAALGLAAILLRGRPHLRLIVLALAAGYAYGAWVGYDGVSHRLSPDEHGQDRDFSGQIAAMPTVQHTLQGRLVRFLYRPDNSDLRRIRVAWYGAETVPRAGECWQLKLRLRTPRGSVNPGGMDYEGWLFRQGIDATATVREAQRCADDQVFSVEAIRQALADHIRQLIPQQPARAFVLGLTVGDRSEITAEQWRVLRRTGIAHLLAISGLHIGLIAGFVLLLVRWLWPRVPVLAQALAAPRAAAVAAGFAALAYAALAGFALPTQRALIMLLLALWAVWLGERIRPAQLLGWALLLVLLVDPFSGQTAGFWLSFAAVGWILYSVTARLRAPSKWTVWLLLQVVLACGLLPLTLLWFNEGSWLAAPVNLLLIPLFSLIVPVVLLAALMTLVWPAAAMVFYTALLWLLEVVWQGLAWLETHTVPLTAGPSPAWLLVVLGLCGLIWLFTPRAWPARAMGLVLCLPLALPALGLIRNHPPQNSLDLTVLDVGQGLSVVLRTAEHVLVYDAGPAYEGGFDAGAMVLVPYLRNEGINRVDLYLQSHGDLDHRGGSVALRSELVVVNELGIDTPCRAGTHWHWDGVDFEVLHPDSDKWRGNNASCVLRVSVGKQVVLLTGDVERPVEAHLLRNAREKLKADVLIVPHHGSNSSSSMGLLNAVSPQLAIVSAGWRNRWDMPRPEVVQRYEVRGIDLLNTANSGAITLRVSMNKGLEKLEKARESAHRFWLSD